MSGNPIHQDESFHLQHMFLLLLFNLLPMYFVLDGSWTPFQVIAFYWVEVVAAGVFAVVRSVVGFFGSLSRRQYKLAVQNFMSAIFMPMHYGFFVVMTCFLVGSFLPEGTPTRKLTSPFVPLEMVVEHIDFFAVFPFFVVWEALLFARQVYHSKRDKDYKLPDPAWAAYSRLMILFVSAFFGLIVAMGVFKDRIWGAIILVAFKTLCALVPLYFEYRKVPKTPEAV